MSGDLIVNSGSVSGNSGEEEGIDVSDDLIVNSGGIVSGTSSTYIGICCESSIIVNGGTVLVQVLTALFLSNALLSMAARSPAPAPAQVPAGVLILTV